MPQLQSYRPRIGLDCHVVDGMHQGSRTHILELASRLIRFGQDLDFYLFADQPEDIISFSGTPHLRNVFPIRMRQANPILRLGFQLPRLCRQYGVDLLHTQYILPVRHVCKAVVTVHDVLFESYPQYFPGLMRARSRLLVRHAVRRRSEHVFTVSQFCKAELMRLYGVSEGKITVIYNGVNQTRFYPGADGQQTLAERGLSSKDYILCVGRQEPRKNHATLLKAYANLGRSAPPLVIVGARDFAFEGIPKLISELGVSDRVRIFEDISDAELPALYRHASCFVYPSWAEGFGMPVLEAFSSGVPVVCSNTTALPEVATGAALTISPGDTLALSNAIRVCLQDKNTVLSLTKQALRRAREFNWDQSALQLLQKYRELVGQAERPLGMNAIAKAQIQ